MKTALFIIGIPFALALRAMKTPNILLMVNRLRRRFMSAAFTLGRSWERPIRSSRRLAGGGNGCLRRADCCFEMKGTTAT